MPKNLGSDGPCVLFIYFFYFFIALFNYFYGVEYGEKQTKTGKIKMKGIKQEKIEF